MKLSKRLQSVASFVPIGATMADIGTDHAYLPVYLVEHQLVKQAIAGDVKIGPYKVAKDTVAKHGLSDKILVRLGDGLSILEPGEVDTIVIAGMGGATMVQMLTACQAPLTNVKLIFQPMVAATVLREWLMNNTWKICAETLVEEDNLLYEIIVAEPGHMEIKDPILLEIGPLLWENRHVLLARHLSTIVLHTKKILCQLDRAKDNPKYEYYKNKLKLLEDKQACL